MQDLNNKTYKRTHGENLLTTLVSISDSGEGHLVRIEPQLFNNYSPCPAKVAQWLSIKL